MTIQERYQIFADTNAGFDFQSQEITGQLNWSGLDKTVALPELKALQRIYRLYPDIDAAFAAFDSGYRSAHGIAAQPEQRFIAEMTPVFKKALPRGTDGKNVAQSMWAGARFMSYQVNLAAAGMLPNAPSEAEVRHFNNLPKFHEGMPSWDTLFGPGYNAQVKECASIYGAAAYFTDLMRIIDTYITSTSTNIPAGLTLQQRRPDLWQIPLDCFTTYHELTYLEIANQVMASKLANDFQQDTAQYLATNYYPFNLPMNQPLEKIRMYLAHFGFTLAEIYQRFQADAATVARESLLLSIEKAGLITAAADVSPEVMYGLYDDEEETDLSSEAFFEAKTGLFPAQVQSLVYQQLRPKQWNGLVFSGNTVNGANRIVIPNSPSLQVAGSQTIEFWMYLPVVPVTGGESDLTTVLSKNYVGEFDFELRATPSDGDNNIILCYRCSNNVAGSSTNYINVFDDTPLNTWCHVAVIRDMSVTPPTLKTHSKDASGNIMGAGNYSFATYPIAATDSDVCIARGSDSGYPFNGTLAEVRIWNRALSTDEIDNNMWRSLSGKEHGLAAYWPMNDGMGLLLSDQSQNKNNGTLSDDLAAQWQVVNDLYFGDYEQNPQLQQQLWINSQGAAGAYLDIIEPRPGIAAGAQLGYSDNSSQWPLLGRFIHFSSQLKWPFADTDWALKSIGSIGLNETDISNMAAVCQLVKQLKQPVDAICALWYDMKTYGMGAAGPSQALFDRVFNTPKAFYNPDGLPDPAPYHPVYEQNPFYHDTAVSWKYTPSGDVTDVTDTQVRNGLLGTLKLKDTELSLIINYLNNQGLITADSLSLTVPNMSLLYRYASLPKWCALPVEQFLQMLHLLGNPAIDNPVKVLELSQWALWLKQNGLNIFQFEYLCGGSVSGQLSKYVQPDVNAFLQQLSEAAPSTMFSPASLSDAGFLQVMAGQIFDSICGAGFCDQQGVILDERPIRAYAVYNVLAPLLGSPVIADKGAFEATLATFDPTSLAPAGQLESAPAVQDLAFITTYHVTRMLQNCRDAQTSLVFQQLATLYKIPVQQLAAVVGVTERQMPSAPVFDAADEMGLSIPWNEEINPQEITLSFWLQFNTFKDEEYKQTLYSTIADSKGFELLYVTENDGPFFQLYLPDGTQAHLPGTVIAGEWYHLLLSIGTPAAGATPYTWSLNGAVSSATLSSTYLPAQSGNTSIGYIPGNGNYLDGRLLDFRIHDYYVTDRAAIMAEMNNAITAEEPGEHLCAWWRLNSRDNATVYDWSGNVNNGTLASTAGPGTWQWHDFNPRQLLVSSGSADAGEFMQQLTLMTAWSKWFNLSAGEVGLISLNPSPFDITAMRYGFVFNLSQLRAFATYKTLHADYRLPGPVLLEYFNTPDDAANKTRMLASAMGWPEDQLSLLEANFVYGDKPLAFPKDYADFNTVNGVNSLSRCFEISTGLEVNITFFFQLRQLSDLALVTGDTDTDNANWSRYVNAADSLEQAIEASYTPAEVKTALQPIEDNIQVLMRDVMSVLLIWELGNSLAGIDTQQDLYEYLLIDVRMTNAVQMSVLKAGLNSLQLYIQRCLSNMENGVNCTLPKEWWAWMGSYREWEANREVYVYPENYVDPTLRKMQSPLFKDLVSQVKQQTASEENVTKAYLNYLDGLKEIASLHVVDSYARPIPGALDAKGGRVVDVFARTLTSPVTYYQRTAIISDPASENISWTPWQNTGLSINSDYLTPVYAFGKLFVFWVEQSNESTTKAGVSYAYIRGTIYYSFQKAGSGWAPTQVLADDIIIKTYNSAGDVTDYYFSFQLNGFNPLSAYEKTVAWNKVTATLLPATANEDAKILVTLGDMVSWINDPNSPFVAADKPETPEQHRVYTYLTRVTDAVLPLTGTDKVTTVVPAYLLDAGLRSEEQTPLLDLSLAEYYNGVLVKNDVSEALAFLPVTGTEALTGLAVHTEAFIKNTPENNVYHAWYDVKGTRTGTIKTMTGPFGNDITCLTFDNNTAHNISLTIPKKLAPLYSEFTIGVWIQTNDLDNCRAIFDTLDFTSSTNLKKGSLIFINYYSGVPYLTYQTYNMDNASYFVDLDLSLNGKQTGKWYYVVVSNSPQSSSSALYDPSTNSWQHAHSSQSEDFTIPHNNLRVGYHQLDQTGTLGYPFNGYITGLQVFNKAISGEEFFNIVVGNPTANMGLANMPQGRSSVIPVKNQPGWFYVNAGRENFMVIPADAAYEVAGGLVNVSYGKYLSVSMSAPAVQPAAVPHYNFIRTSTNVVDALLEKVFAGGVGELLQPLNQLLAEPDFNVYQPNTAQLTAPFPLMDFNGAYGMYFWELFFQIPFYFAENLQLNLKFSLAKKWYEYIFDPNVPLNSTKEPEGESPRAKAPVAFWPLETPAKEVALSVTGHYDGKTSGAISWAMQDGLPFAASERGINYFDAGNGYLTVPYNSAINTPQFSISFWVKIDTDLVETNENDVYACLIDTMQSSAAGFQVNLYKYHDGNTIFLVNIYNDTNGRNQLQTSQYQVLVGQWYHFVMTCDGSSFNVYINGQDKTKYTHSQPITSYAPNVSNDLLIGSGLQGYLANVVLWDFCLTGKQLDNLFERGFPDIAEFDHKKDLGGQVISMSETLEETPALSENLVASWPLSTEEKTGTIPSRNGHYNGQVTGELSWTVMHDLPFLDGPRAVNCFNGANGYVAIPYNAALNTAQFSVSFWIYMDQEIPVNTTGQGTTYCTLIKSGNNTGFEILLYKWQSETTTFLTYAFDNHQDSNEKQTNYPVTPKNWYHLILCLAGTAYTVYINGPAGYNNYTQNLISTYTPNTTEPLLLGSGFTGYMANVNFWNTCLTSDQVNELMENDIASVTTPIYRKIKLAPAKRFWQFVPFRNLIYSSLYNELTTTSGQYLLYEYDPFDPDAIASQRPGAYAKGIFMRYISNLIDYGDNLFTQDTWESITEATMYYVLASDLLGRPHQQDAAEKQGKPATYNEIESDLDGLVPPFLVDLETAPTPPNTLTAAQSEALEQRWSIFSAYFGIPGNTQLLSYRKTIEDRLYKIRHGLNINGQTNNIPLFEPPINPANAAAAAGPGGSGVGSISSSAPAVPYYRFSYLLDLARSFTSEVIRLGDELLAALEKQDAEYLSLLRETQGNVIYTMMTQIKQDQVNQLYAEQSNLQASLANAQLQQNTYSRWIADGWNNFEIAELAMLADGVILSQVATLMTFISSPMYLFPTIFGLADGGVNFGGSFEASAQGLKAQGEVAAAVAGMLGIKGNFDRTNDQWDLQMNMATNEIAGINAQLQANNFAIQIAEQDYNVNQTQIEQSNTVISFLQTKFTNEELYEWMASDVSSVYYQAYQLACGLAQMAQTAYQFELSMSDTYINTSSWSNQYRGLQAGDGLMLSLNQLEQAYIKQNSRSLEISRTISLARLNPTALMNLKTAGSCTFQLSEYLFDTDFPGHYNRKIKTMAITIPAVVGPYQNIKATLVQTSNSVVTKANANAVSYLLGTSLAMPSDGSLRMNWNPGQEIALSSGTSDSGMFQLNFNDERYLPFENTGAVSSWQLNMPKAANQFDFNSINDVIIELKYYATDGGSTFKQQVLSGNPILQQYSGSQLLSLRQQFGDAWQQFLTSEQTSIELVRRMYPPNLDTVSLVPDTKSPVILVPVLSDQALLGDISAIIFAGMEIDTITTANAVIFEDPALVSVGAPVTWSLSTVITPGSALLTGSNTIDPKKWLDVILLIPYSGTLDWS